TIPLINIADPKQSRFYTRLAVDGHNCWTDCATAASQMLNAIKQFTDPIQAAAKTAPSAADTYLASDAVNLFQDGIVASGGGRYEADQIALYNFKTGSGNTILDVSGVSPAMNLTLSGTEGVDYKWMSNWGIEFDTKNAKAQALTSDSTKLANLISVNNLAGYSIEAWVAPANTTQPANNNMVSDIVTYTGGSTVGNNFSLGQRGTNYESFNRDTTFDTTGNGGSQWDVPGLTASLQHVVLTYDPSKGRSLYINGVLKEQDTSIAGQSLANWISNFALVLGNDASRQSSWLGQIRMLAIDNAPLTAAEVKQNYDAGVGQQYFLLFNISSHLGAECNPATGPSCFILMKASVFDNTSYLFSEPRFINLNDPNVSTEPPVLLKGMRIGINGNDSGNDQVFSRMDVCVNGPCAFSTVDARTRDVSYQKGITPADGALLSSQGAVIAMQNGPRGNGGLAPDMIFLTFDAINDAAKPHTIVSTSSLTSPTPTVHPVVNDNILVHSFEEIDATLAKLTGIPRTDIASTYASVIQSLPSTHDAGSYNSANQMAVTQLAISYCSTMVNNQETADTNGRNNNKFFPNITFNKTNQTITSTSGVNQQGLSFTADDVNDIVQPLISHLMNVEYNGTAAAKTLSFMPVYSQVQSYLADLINGGTINTSAGPITVQGLAPTTVSNNSPAPCGQGTSYCSYARSIQIIKATCTAAVASAPMLLH
ncbi:MAG: LamG domain-containing protein, partial [Gammaproteobacteria bacterium]